MLLAIAGQTSGPNWLNLFEGTYGYPDPWGLYLLKNEVFSKTNFFIFKIRFKKNAVHLS